MTASSGSTTQTFGGPFCKRSSIDKSSGALTSSSSGGSCKIIGMGFFLIIGIGFTLIVLFHVLGLCRAISETFFEALGFLEEFSFICLRVNVRLIIIFIGGRWSKMWRHIINDNPN